LPAIVREGRSTLPVAYHIDGEDGLITVRGEAPLDPDELLATGRRLMADTRYDPALPQLIDLRGVPLDGWRTASPALHELGDFVRGEYRDSVRSTVAVVIDAGLDSHTVAACYRVTCVVSTAELFDDYRQALGWLLRRTFGAVPDSG
jgi:hypothetical protein